MQSSFDTSNELFLSPDNSGVKFIRPEKIKHPDNHSTIASLLNLPFNVFFLGHGSQILNGNEHCAIMMNVDSVPSYIGKTVLDFSTRKSAEKVLENDRNVMMNNQRLITDEIVDLEDSVSTVLTYKSPVHDAKNKVIGVFGASIRIDTYSADNIAMYISTLSKLGLLNSAAPQQDKTFQTPISQPSKLHFTNREHDIIKNLLLSRSAKMIARILGISFRTVETHISNLKEKTKTQSKNELIEKLIYLKSGMI